MKKAPAVVTPDLRVFAVTSTGTELTITLYGGPKNAFGTVVFGFPTVDERVRREVLAKNWHAEDVAVELVQRPDKWTLRPSLARRRPANEIDLQAPPAPKL